jgi:hypothetical protein
LFSSVSFSGSQIHRKLYGRSFYFNDPDDVPKFEELGGHDLGCTGVVVNAAKWTVEVIQDENSVRCESMTEALTWKEFS